MKHPIFTLLVALSSVVPKCSPSDAASDSAGGASSRKTVNTVCRVSRLDECGDNQMCVQQQDHPDLGLCECLPGFDLQDDEVFGIKKIDQGKIHQVFFILFFSKFASRCRRRRRRRM